MRVKMQARKYWFVGFKKWSREIYLDMGFVRLYIDWIKGVKE